VAAAVAFETLSLWSYVLRATAGNSLENRFPEYLAVTSRCTGCQECQEIFVPSGHLLNSGKSKNRRGLNQMDKVDGPFL
jgi:hypothetical protein